MSWDSVWSAGFGPWGWLALGVALLALEAAVSGFFLLWFAIGALLTAGVAAVLPGGLSLQITVFAVVSVLALLVGRPLVARRQDAAAAAANGLNRRSDAVIGLTVVLVTPLRHGQGRVQVGDGEWSARCVDGGDLPAGATVVIDGVDGNTLLVRPHG